MRDDRIRDLLLDLNPWWRAATGGTDRLGWTVVDRTLASRAPFDLGYRPQVLSDITTGPITDQLVILRGPRRAGKSVLLKDVVVALCGRPELDPRQIVYVVADGMQEHDLFRSMALGRELTRSIDGEGPLPRVWLLDEITSVTGWTATLKSLRDNTALGDDTVVCTGSSWSDEATIGRDLLAGRAGTSSTRRTRLLLPMSFREYLAATRPDVPRPGSVELWDMQAAPVRKLCEELQVFATDFDFAWQSYLTCGGFPRAVSEHTRDGAVSTAFLEDLLSWLGLDVDSDAPRDSLLRLLSELHARSSSPLNRAATGVATGYQNRQTFDLRLTRLVRSFGALRCPQRGEDGRRVDRARPKVYLADPLIAWLGAHLHAGFASPNMPTLSESVLGVTMAAAIENAQPNRWIADETIGYLRTGKGNEVDLAPVAVPSPGGAMLTTPIESKWVSQGWRSESRPLTGKLGRGVVATKNLTDVSGAVWAVPAPLVALLMR